MLCLQGHNIECIESDCQWLLLVSEVGFGTLQDDAQPKEIDGRTRNEMRMSKYFTISVQISCSVKFARALSITGWFAEGGQELASRRAHDIHITVHTGKR